jgi:Fur family ferric uptake transcriptional regulator
VSAQATKTARSSPRGDWAEHALAALTEAGYRRGGARTAVVEALAGHDCAVTALDLDDELRRRKPAVGRASVYRALEQLEQLGLVQRIEVCRGTAGYERVDPTGHHHHHAICRDCGRMVPFEDSRLERALAHVAGEMPGFAVAEHDVVLRGVCDRCAR